MPGQWVLLIERYQQLFRQHYLVDDIFQRVEEAVEAQVDTTLAQGGDLCVLAHVVQHHLDLGEVVAKLQQDGRNGIQNRRAENTDIQSPQFALTSALGTLGGLLHDRTDITCLFQQQLPRRGQVHASWSADEQLYIQLFFELLNLPGQRRLGNVQTRSGPADVSFFSDSNEIA